MAYAVLLRAPLFLIRSAQSGQQTNQQRKRVMIEINSYGGQIGRFWWKNSSNRPGLCGWREAWPDFHLWPISPWMHRGLAPTRTPTLRNAWLDFTAFESWFDCQMKTCLDERYLTTGERIELYYLLCDIFDAGIQAGRNPWKWANQLANQPTEEP